MRKKGTLSQTIKGLTPQDRLERYATLFAFTEENDIDINSLADHWGASERGVAGMVGAAKKNKKLYEDMRSLGFEDTEFPEWGYSPAQNKVEQVPKTAEGSGTDRKSVEQTDVLTPATPKIPLSMDDSTRRPPLPVQYRSVPLGTGEYERVPGSTTELLVGTDDFTSEELDLLGSKAIVRSPQGEWFHSEKYPDGRTMITPVNPHAELRRLSDVHANGSVTSRTADTPNSRSPV